MGEYRLIGRRIVELECALIAIEFNYDGALHTTLTFQKLRFATAHKKSPAELRDETWALTTIFFVTFRGS